MSEDERVWVEKQFAELSSALLDADRRSAAAALKNIGTGKVVKFRPFTPLKEVMPNEVHPE